MIRGLMLDDGLNCKRPKVLCPRKCFTLQDINILVCN